MPRRNPDLTGPTHAPAGIPETYHLLDGVAVHVGEAPPADARPGDILTRDGVQVGSLGLDGRGRVTLVGHHRTRALHTTTPAGPRTAGSVVEDVARANGITLPQTPISQQFGTLPAEYQPASHGPAVGTSVHALTEAMVTGTPVVSPPDHPVAAGIIAGINAAIANTAAPALQNMAAAIREANAPARPAEETYEGPRVLATIAHGVTGAGERFTTNTRTAQAAAERAALEFSLRARYANLSNRAQHEVTANIVDHNASHIDRFLISGFGLELNEEALTAVTAMTATIAAKAAEGATARAELAEAALAVERNAREALQGRLARAEGAISATPDVEAAIEAAKAWKDTPLTESVAKRDSFLHLLDTLNRMAG